MKKGPKPRPEAERFWSHVDVFEDDECWVWTAFRQYGYGRFCPYAGKTVQAHRWAYEHEVGPIPDGLEIDHLCRNRACVNPSHLEPVTRRVNLLRGETFARTHHLKTHCPKGHPYTPENTYIQTRGSSAMRSCKTCRRARW